MCKLKPTLEKWLEEAEAKDSVLSPNGVKNKSGVAQARLLALHHHHGAARGGPRRRRRTSIENAVKISLEKAFGSNPRPTSEELHLISESLGIEREVVRVWFCNRRQKQKRTLGDLAADDAPEHGATRQGGRGGRGEPTILEDEEEGD